VLHASRTAAASHRHRRPLLCVLLLPGTAAAVGLPAPRGRQAPWFTFVPPLVCLLPCSGVGLHRTCTVPAPVSFHG
jgi:hypothetical protein